MKESTRIFSISPVFRHRSWSDQCVVYHVPTGETHLLEALSADVVRQLLNAGSMSFDELYRKVVLPRSNKYSSALLDTYLRQLALSGIVLVDKSS